MTRNILDYQGNIIGELTLPDNTSEDAWSVALAPYALPPPSAADLVASKLKEYADLAPKIIRDIKTANTLAGITPQQSAEMLSYMSDVLSAVNEGMLPTALYLLDNKVPSGFVTQDMIDSWILLIQDLL